MLQFKSTKYLTEFNELERKNGPLAQVIHDLAEFVQYEFQKDVIVTHVFRPKATQEQIYGKGTTRTSPHSVWKAVDIRDRIYTGPEKQKIIEFLKTHYDAHNRMTHIQAAKSKTVWLHQVGANGMHFHIQYSGPLVMTFSEPMLVTA